MNDCDLWKALIDGTSRNATSLSQELLDELDGVKFSVVRAKGWKVDLKKLESAPSAIIRVSSGLPVFSIASEPGAAEEELQFRFGFVDLHNIYGVDTATGKDVTIIFRPKRVLILWP